jgi:formylglycine-generating enzyme required for sulfatase activity
MKYLLVIAMFSVSNIVCSQKYLEAYVSKNIDKNYVKVDSTLFCSKYEVTNVNYRDFLSDLKKSGKNEEYTLMLPDTNGWKSKLAYNDPYVELYFRHPAYQNYPVVNVSYEQAIKYCEWLSQKYNAQTKKEFKKVVFRLPSINEWERAACGGSKETDYPWGNYFLENYKGEAMCNYYQIGDEHITFDTTMKKFVISSNSWVRDVGIINESSGFIVPVSSYFQNGIGIYNIAGNVSEMMNEKGIAKGGSWKSPGYDVRIKSEEFYTKSCNHIGFRVFMQVLEF